MQPIKHPRTLQEAFGPYTSHTITEIQRPLDWQDKVVIAVSIITVILVAAFVGLR